jgi:ATP-dependent Clp protease protease subunit
LKSNLLYADAQLNLILNSTGGDCNEGFAIIDTMTSSRLPVITTGLGSILSMGVLVLSAGEKGKRRLTKNSEIMAHQFAASFYGKQHELLATSKALQMLERRFKRHFAKHTSMTDAQIKDVLFSPSDRYLTPNECKRFGICDIIVDSL